MCSGEDAILFKKLEYHEDFTKFGKLGLWILTSMGAKDIELEELIGEIPVKELTEKELTEDEKGLIEFAKENGLRYKITKDGVRIKT